MMRKKSIFWMNLVLVFALVVGLAFPAANVSAASKSKKKKVLVVYFSATGTTKSAAKKVKNLTKYDVIFIGYPIWLAYHNLIQCTQA